MLLLNVTLHFLFMKEIFRSLMKVGPEITQYMLLDGYHGR